MGSYDNPNATVRREANAQERAGGGATTEYAKFFQFQKTKLVAAHALVTVAGTNAGHGLDVYNGTTSVGTIALGTSAAGSTASSGALNSAVAALGAVSVKTLVDATGVAIVNYEYEVEPDAVLS